MTGVLPSSCQVYIPSLILVVSFSKTQPAHMRSTPFKVKEGPDYVFLSRAQASGTRRYDLLRSKSYTSTMPCPVLLRYTPIYPGVCVCFCVASSRQDQHSLKSLSQNLFSLTNVLLPENSKNRHTAARCVVTLSKKHSAEWMSAPAKSTHAICNFCPSSCSFGCSDNILQILTGYAQPYFAIGIRGLLHPTARKVWSM